MMKFSDYYDEQMDTIEVSERQKLYLFALGLRDACSHIGK